MYCNAFQQKQILFSCEIFILLYATIFCEADIYYETWSTNKLKLKCLIF